MTTAEMNLAERLGFAPGQVVREIGWDEDCDDELRQSVEEVTGTALLDEDTDEAVDVVLLWWRENEGDLADGLMDAVSGLKDGGCIWLVTPKTGREGYVEPSDVQEGAQVAGLTQVTSLVVAVDWAGTKLVRPSH
ncbi:DUF3052 domain-containing protein [Streptomyces albidochromogenes]|uniref:DUF3052 domain-containing protein n=1 Tax=Streptomyces albidochromogenes TaxID=329524 RepID=A0ABW6FFT3_9ACTN